LYPGREASRLGLQQGFMPHALPAVCMHPARACQSGFSETDALTGSPQVLDSMSIVEPDLLRKSEFMLPLNDEKRELYADMLKDL
jgi:hypothetical protein